MTKRGSIGSIFLSALACACSPALATEGALGRPISGMQIAPFSGVVPADPGMIWSFGHVRYDGDIKASREVPIAGKASLGLAADLTLTTVTGVYVWPTPASRWNFASMATAPYIVNDVSTYARIGTASSEARQDASSFYDFYFAPVIASYHVSEMKHWSFSAYVYAPTARYDSSRTANPGLNVWTVSPTIAYTQLFLQGGVELSASAAVDFYSKNKDTDYRNGDVGRVEGLAILRGTRGFGGGAVASAIRQLERDEGPLADRLGGFKGSALGLGPIITYSRKWDDSSLDLSIRYVKESKVKNRLKGEPVMLSLSMKF